MSRLAALIEEAVSDGLPDMALMNCHTMGVDSVVLRYAEKDGKKTLMQRLFIAHHDMHGLDRLTDPNGQYVLGVHNHRYPLQLQPAVGIVVNHEVTLVPGYSSLYSSQPRGQRLSNGWYEAAAPQSTFPNLWEFRFQSGIGGDIELTLKTGRRIKDVDYRYMVAGDTRFMTSDELHTVVLPKKPGMPPITAWLVTEYADEREALFYSPIRNPHIDSRDLYEPLLVSEAELLLEEVLRYVPVVASL